MKKHNVWVSAEQLNNDPEFIQSAQQEFAQTNVSLEDVTGESGTVLSSNRRDFLKYLGFSLGAATLASCEIPIKKGIPYTHRPEDIVPGVANYYASTIVNGGDYCAVLVKTREGRPIKIEGNNLSKITQGGTSARAQASVLSLYDTNRLRGPKKGDGTDVTWTDLDNAVKGALASSNKIVVVMNTQLSPTLAKAAGELATRYAGKVEFVTYDGISQSGMLEANQAMFGLAGVPNYHFDRAKTIVSFDADFLGTWVSPVEYAKDYIKRRKVYKMKDARQEMSRHIQVESGMSLTGSNADNRVLVKPSEMGAAVALLYNEVAAATGNAGVSGPSADFSWEKAAGSLKKVAAELVASKGESLVVCGINNKNIQLLVNGINTMLENYGKTLEWNGYSKQRQGTDAGINALVDNLGGVDTLILYRCNPAYDLPGRAAEFASKLPSVKMSVALSEVLDETAKLCKFVAPDHNVLESWGDAEAKKGSYSLIQPTIKPLFNTRQAGSSFLVWADSASAAGDYHDYLKANWMTTMFAQQSEFALAASFWEHCLHDGIFDGNASVTVTAAAADMNAAAAALPKPAAKEAIEVDFFETIMAGDGTYANNPWLHEMPDPVRKTTWDNFISVPIHFDGDSNFIGFKDLKDGDLAKIVVNGVELEMPVVRQFGQHPNTVSVALGYGRTDAGKAGNGTGKNAYPAVKNGIYSGVAEVSGKTGHDEWFACAQLQHTYGIMGTLNGKEVALDEHSLGNKGFDGALLARSVFFNGTADQLYAEKSEEFDGNTTLAELKEKRAEYKHLNDLGIYPNYDNIYERGHHWGMSVDLTACIGCGACTVACMAENNVPVVGKRENARVHDMAWLRIDRYFYGDVETPNTAYMPMMCQHCQNAPCENVCPVNATNHSSEGLNQMTYNRCIGTRYCANNCPFKVRRFNWLDYTSADLFPGNQVDLNRDRTEEEFFYMTDNLTRMVLNPDVTVRSRGVIEKCSFCVQRIQAGKLTAKVEGRPLADGDVKVACQTACPTGAIVFGDRNNKEGELMKDLWETPLNYIALEEINVRPTVTYLMKVTNTKSEKSES